MLSYILTIFLSIFGTQPMYNSTITPPPPPPPTPETTQITPPNLVRPGH
ncbi:MAG: hypothetical protein J0M03_15015 [Acidobacteria bacterium]|nr:hypothetical protein [Acidobacteriota bacterium]